MKSLLLCIVALASTAFAAVPAVVIDNNFNCFLDGSNAGKVGDVIVNFKSDAALVVAVNNAVTAKLAAILAARDAAIASKETEKQAAITAAQAARDAAIATAQSQRDAAIAAAQAQRDTAVAARNAAEARADQIAAAAKTAQFVGPPPPALAAAILTAKEAERARLIAAKADAEAKLAALP